MSSAEYPEDPEYRSQDNSISDNVPETMFQMMFAKFVNSDSYKPTEEQFDKLLSLKEKSMDYAHKEKTQVLPQHRFDGNRNLIMAIIVLTVFLVVFLCVLSFAPEHLDKLISLFAGLLGGYGVGKSDIFSTNKKDKSED